MSVVGREYDELKKYNIAEIHDYWRGKNKVGEKGESDEKDVNDTKARGNNVGGQKLGKPEAKIESAMFENVVSATEAQTPDLMKKEDIVLRMKEADQERLTAVVP